MCESLLWAEFVGGIIIPAPDTYLMAMCAAGVGVILLWNARWPDLPEVTLRDVRDVPELARKGLIRRRVHVIPCASAEMG